MIDYDNEEPAPTSHASWLKMLAGEPISRITEAGIYTDATIIGDFEIGPYKFLNTLASIGSSGVINQGVTLRIASHWQFEGFKPFNKTNAAHYHGGDQYDEMAALVSLFLGIRAQAGPITREFIPERDPLGNPMILRNKPIPSIMHSPGLPVLPRLNTTVSLDDLGQIEKFPSLPVPTANALIKVARLYQQALWVSDMQPAMAWLLLVSAVETAANFWRKSNPSADNTRAIPRDIAELIELNGYTAIIKPLSDYLAQLGRVEKTFIEFLLKFLPLPPSVRPKEIWAQVKYSPPELSNAFKTIYNHRSRALHDGAAFPYPMCTPPHEIREEVPMGLGTRTQNAVWMAADTPMLLHMFEHIVRGALLKWIESL